MDKAELKRLLLAYEDREAYGVDKEKSLNDTLVDARRGLQSHMGDALKTIASPLMGVASAANDVHSELTGALRDGEGAEPVAHGSDGDFLGQLDSGYTSAAYSNLDDIPYANIFEQPETTPEEEVKESPDSDFASMLAEKMPDLDFSGTEQIMGERKEMLEQMRGRLDELQGREYQTDLSPFLAFVDATTGSNMAQSYKAPQTREERDKLASYIESRMSSESRAIGADQMKMQIAKRDANYKNVMLKIKQRQAMRANPDLVLKKRKDARDQEKHTTDQDLKDLKIMKLFKELKDS